jgi:hypothetical protein
MNKRYKFPQVKMRMALLVVLGVFVMALALLGVGLGYAAMVRNNTALELARIVPMRDLLVRAIDGIKMDAPIDPKTGDAYFPPTKLYLPGAAAETAGLTYRYEKDLGLSVRR